MADQNPLFGAFDKIAEAFVKGAERDREAAATLDGLADILTDEEVRQDIEEVLAHASLVGLGILMRLQDVIPSKSDDSDNPPF